MIGKEMVHQRKRVLDQIFVHRITFEFFLYKLCHVTMLFYTRWKIVLFEFWQVHNMLGGAGHISNLITYE